MLHSMLLANASAGIEATAQTGADPINFQTALLVIITGALVFLSKNLIVLNRRLAALEAGGKTQATPSANAHASSPAAHTHTGFISPQVVAAISAAVHTTFKGRHRIISVGEFCPNRQAWSAEGRRQVFSSHNVR